MTAPTFPGSLPRFRYMLRLQHAMRLDAIGASQAVVLLTRYDHPRFTLADAAKQAGVPAVCVVGLRCPVMAADAASAAALPAVRAWLGPQASWRASAGGRAL